jgi:hypothetical protein
MDFLKYRFISISLLLSLSSLWGEVYILSYKIVVKNSKISSESLYISSPMRKSRYLIVDSIEVDGKREDSDRKIIDDNREEILEFLFKSGVSVNDFTRNYSSQTTLLLPPIYIAIDRVTSGAFITLLRK